MKNLNLQELANNCFSLVYNDKIGMTESFQDIENLPKTSVLIDGFLCVFVISGTGQSVIDGNMYTIRSGDLFACTPRNILEESLFSTDFRFVSIFMKPEYAESIANMVNLDWTFRTMVNRHEVIHFKSMDYERILKYFELLKDKLNSQESDNKQKSIDSLICSFAFEIFDAMKMCCGMDVPLQSFSSAESLFQRFIKMVSDSSVSFTSVNDYAKALNVTPKYFSSVCKRLSGKTASEIINEEIIKTSKIMLRDNTKSIKQIADSLNFANQSHFGTFFRRHVGMSPQQYRSKSSECFY